MAKKEAELERDEETQENEDAGKKAGLSTIKIIIIAVTLTLFLGGGLVGGTLYFVTSMNPAQASTTKNTADKTADNDEAENADEEADDEEEVVEDKVTEPPQYYSMDPKFIVSFSNQKFARFMQFSLEIMSRDGEIIKKVETHNPVIRSSLLMLFGSQGYDEMVTREGKENLLNEVTADINSTLNKITGDADGIEAAYFTSFVIQ